MNIFASELYCNCIHNRNMFAHLFQIRLVIIIVIRLDICIYLYSQTVRSKKNIS